MLNDVLKENKLNMKSARGIKSPVQSSLRVGLNPIISAQKRRTQVKRRNLCET
jgi:hypothetical protein